MVSRSAQKAVLVQSVNTRLRPVQASWSDYQAIILDCIQHYPIRKVLEIGAGPNPSLSATLIKKYNLEYHTNDFYETELEKGHNAFKTFPGDFLQGAIPEDNKYDLIISQMVLEHISTPVDFHKQVIAHLSDNGIVIHFYATLYSLPAILNLILPESFSSKLVKWGQGRSEFYHSKFPASYKWCLGPVKNFGQRFNELGFVVKSHQGYVGHNYLIKRRFLWRIEKLFSSFLLKLNSPFFCSNSVLVLQKEINK